MANVLIDATGIEYCDGAGIALLVHLRRLQNKANGDLRIDGLRPEFADLLDDGVARVVDVTGKTARPGIAEEIGEATVEVSRDIQILVSFVGELGAGLRMPRSIRAACAGAMRCALPRWESTLYRSWRW